MWWISMFSLNLQYLYHKQVWPDYIYVFGFNDLISGDNFGFDEKIREYGPSSMVISHENGYFRTNMIKYSMKNVQIAICHYDMTIQ